MDLINSLSESLNAINGKITDSYQSKKETDVRNILTEIAFHMGLVSMQFNFLISLLEITLSEDGSQEAIGFKTDDFKVGIHGED